MISCNYSSGSVCIYKFFEKKTNKQKIDFKYLNYFKIVCRGYDSVVHFMQLKINFYNKK